MSENDICVCTASRGNHTDEGRCPDRDGIFIGISIAPPPEEVHRRFFVLEREFTQLERKARRGETSNRFMGEENSDLRRTNDRLNRTIEEMKKGPVTFNRLEPGPAAVSGKPSVNVTRSSPGAAAPTTLTPETIAAIDRASVADSKDADDSHLRGRGNNRAATSPATGGGVEWATKQAWRIYSDEYSQGESSRIGLAAKIVAEAYEAGRGEATPSPTPFYIVFDGPPAHESGRFIEAENENGSGLRVGKWAQRDDGLWTLGPFVEAPPPATEEIKHCEVTEGHPCECDFCAPMTGKFVEVKTESGAGVIAIPPIDSVEEDLDQDFTTMIVENESLHVTNVNQENEIADLQEKLATAHTLLKRAKAYVPNELAQQIDDGVVGDGD